MNISVSRLHFHFFNGIFQRAEVLNFGGSLILVASTVSGREHSPTQQQKMGLKIYWTCPHSSEQDPDSATASPSRQEASTSLLPLSIRGQTD